MKHAFRGLLVSGVLWMAIAEAGMRQTELDRQLNLVVRVSIHRAGQVDETAAGLFVGTESQNAYFITACHAFEDDCLQRFIERPPVQSVQVQFRNIQALKIDASIFERYDSRLDLGVVHIPLASLPSGLPQAARNDVAPNMPVLIVGHPVTGGWSTWPGTVRNDNVSNAVEKFITNRDALLSGGYSGGPVFDSQGSFIGMHIETDAAYGFAAKSGDIVRRLQAWGVPTNNFATAELDRVAVVRLLADYEGVFKTLDAPALWKLWPTATAERRRGIENYFGAASSITRTLQMDTPVISSGGSEATVSGKFTDVFIPLRRSTPEPTRTGTITFILKKVDGVWTIADQN